MRPTDEQVERAAQAIRDVVARRSPKAWPGKPWDKLSEKLREGYRAEAQAALEVIR